MDAAINLFGSLVADFAPGLASSLDRGYRYFLDSYFFVLADVIINHLDKLHIIYIASKKCDSF